MIPKVQAALNIFHARAMTGLMPITDERSKRLACHRYRMTMARPPYTTRTLFECIILFNKKSFL